MGLLNFFKKGENNDHDGVVEKPCPNCWGYQEWSGGIKDAVQDHQKDVNNHVSKDAFVKNIQVTYVDGIQSKKDGTKGVYYCNKCQKNYTVG